MTASGKKKPNKVTKVRAEEVHSRPSDDDDDTTTAAPKKNELTEETKAAYFERCWKAVDDANTSGYFFEGIEDPYAFTAISSRCVTLEQVGVDGSWKAKLRTVPNHGYEDGSCEVGKQLGYYADAMNSKYTPALSVGGGHIAVPELQLHDDEERKLPDKKFSPDCGIRVVSDLEHRLVVESNSKTEVRRR